MRRELRATGPQGKQPRAKAHERHNRQQWRQERVGGWMVVVVGAQDCVQDRAREGGARVPGMSLYGVCTWVGLAGRWCPAERPAEKVLCDRLHLRFDFVGLDREAHARLHERVDFFLRLLPLRAVALRGLRRRRRVVFRLRVGAALVGRTRACPGARAGPFLEVRALGCDLLQNHLLGMVRQPFLALLRALRGHVRCVGERAADDALVLKVDLGLVEREIDQLVQRGLELVVVPATTAHTNGCVRAQRFVAIATATATAAHQQQQQRRRAGPGRASGGPWRGLSAAGSADTRRGARACAAAPQPRSCAAGRASTPRGAGSASNGVGS